MGKKRKNPEDVKIRVSVSLPRKMYKNLQEKHDNVSKYIRKLIENDKKNK